MRHECPSAWAPCRRKCPTLRAIGHACRRHRGPVERTALDFVRNFTASMTDADGDGGSASRAPRIRRAVGPLESHGPLRSRGGKLVMISGECRVEPVGLSTGHQLALDGLRLRLDLRIVPGTAEDGSAAAIWRVEDGRIRTLRLGVPEVYRRAAMLTGVGVLVLALVIWFAGSSAPSEGASAAPPASQVITTTVTPAVGGASGATPSVVHAPSLDVSPNVAPLAPPAAPSDVTTSAARAPTAAPPAAAPPPEEPAAASDPSPPVPDKPAVAPRPRPAAVRAPAGDNLDLFSDPK